MREAEAREAARAFWFSAIAHGAIVAAFGGFSLIHGCARPPKPRELITYIDVAAAAPRGAAIPALVEPPPRMPDPRPVVPSPPAPTPPPRDIPEPRPRETPPPRPPPRPSPPRVERPRTRRPALTRQEIAEQLARGLPTAAAPRDDFPFGWYFSLVRQTLYEAWIQPSGLASAAGRATLVTLRVERDGTISRRQLVESSGDARMDESVMRAVNSVKKLRPLPDAYRGSYRDITIEFELTNR